MISRQFVLLACLVASFVTCVVCDEDRPRWGSPLEPSRRRRSLDEEERERWEEQTPSRKRRSLGTGTFPMIITPGSPSNCPPVPNCGGGGGAGATGPTCITSCSGRANGDYQSCQGCDVYATCSNGILYDNRPCAPGGLVWDDNVKRCEWTSPTCSLIACGELNANIRTGVHSISGSGYTWLMTPANVPSATCETKGLVRIDAPASAVEIAIRLRILAGFSHMATIHIAGMVQNDGFGDRGYAFNFGPNDAEMHLNFGGFQAYTSMQGNYQYYSTMMSFPQGVAELDVCIIIRSGKIYVSSDALKVTLVHQHLFDMLQPMFVGINRPIASTMYPRYGWGSGLCKINIIWST